MKTATVRDLRNRYTSLLSWIEAGEEIVITRKGKTVARLVPERADPSRMADWSRSPAVKRERTDSSPITAAESLQLIHEASGKW